MLLGAVVLLSEVPQSSEVHDKGHRGQGEPQSCLVVHPGPVTRRCDPGPSSSLPELASKRETIWSREFFGFFKRIYLRGILSPAAGGWVISFSLRMGEVPLSVLAKGWGPRRPSGRGQSLQERELALSPLAALCPRELEEGGGRSQCKRQEWRRG